VNLFEWAYCHHTSALIQLIYQSARVLAKFEVFQIRNQRLSCESANCVELSLPVLETLTETLSQIETYKQLNLIIWAPVAPRQKMFRVRNFRENVSCSGLYPLGLNNSLAYCSKDSELVDSLMKWSSMDEWDLIRPSRDSLFSWRSISSPFSIFNAHSKFQRRLLVIVIL
jgi:hypothetical protein